MAAPPQALQQVQAGQQPPATATSAPAQPPPPVNLQGYLEDVPEYVYEIDPQVLDRPVKIRIEASRRMNNRNTLRDMLNFIGPMIMNAQFLERMAEIGNTIDVAELYRLLEDASGTGGSYQLMRPFTQAEQTARMTPPPQLQAEQAQAQLEAQTRLQMGQMKSQTELQVAQMEAATEDKRIAEESARAILAILQKERSDLMKAGKSPQQVQMELQAKGEEIKLKLAGQQQKLALDREKAGMDLQTSQMEHQLALQQSQQSHSQSMAQGAQSMQMDVIRQKMLAPSPTKKAQRGSKSQE